MLADASGGDAYSTLVKNGICGLGQPFPAATIERWNRLLDPEFDKYGDSPKVDISAERLDELGIFSAFFDEKMRRQIYRLMPDAVLHEFTVIETAGNQQRPHVFGERQRGWHPDIMPLPGLDHRLPNYLHLFVYLSDVGLGDGGFEFLPLSSGNTIKPGMETIEVRGDRGTAFVWNRAYYHRASPNTGPTRRRALRFLFQHNYLANAVIEDGRLDTLRKRYEGDEFISYLLGKRHETAQQGIHFLPPQTLPLSEVFTFSVNANVERFSLADQARLWVRKLLKIGESSY